VENCKSARPSEVGLYVRWAQWAPKLASDRRGDGELSYQQEAK
jgi:hypothetical protein